jgi:putative oxygen-independent coproporphyrinogen III oxidase
MRFDDAVGNGIPLSLYIHLPWCVRKCPYCDFNSHEAIGGQIPEQEYIDALTADVQASLPLVWGRPVQNIFFGGGTPSLFSGQGIAAILQMVRTLFKVNPQAEISLEANPGAVDEARFEQFAQAGVNRISLGVQSFNAKHLSVLGRIHDPEAARSAATTIARVFPRFNLDLMFGLPQQTLAQCLDDVRQALDFAPEHLSLYQLTMEPNTRFAMNPPAGLPDDDVLAEMQDAVEQAVAAQGLERYEVSAFAKPGAQCRHNLNYWQFGDYLGIGAGAHGKLTMHDRIVRTNKQRHPGNYMALAKTNPAALASVNQIALADLPFEFMLNALRLKEGVSASLFTERTRLPKGFGMQIPRAYKPVSLGGGFSMIFRSCFLRPKSLLLRVCTR